MASITEQVTQMPFLHLKWDDGCEQYCLKAMHQRTSENDALPFISIERVVGPKSRRKLWCIVIRVASDDLLYAPKLVKVRFKSPEEAKPLYLTLCILHGWRVG